MMAILLNKWTWIALAFAAVAGAAGIQTYRLKLSHADVATAAARIAALNTQAAALGEDIKRQNAAVDLMAKAGDAARQKGAQALAAAHNQAEPLKAEVASLQADLEAARAAKQPGVTTPAKTAPPPAGQALTCTDAVAEIRGAL